MALAQPQPNVLQPQGPPEKAQPASPGGADAKLQNQLLDVVRRPNIAMTRGQQVEVDIVADVSDELVSHIRQLGGTVINSFPAEHAIRARIPGTALRTLAAHPNVKFVRPAVRPLNNQTSAPSGTPGIIEGDVAHRADVARTRYGAKGSGVKVCVISDSIDDSQGSFAAAMNSHDVPASLKPLAGQAGSGGGEGLAMLEIVHKLAPDAELSFATQGPNGAQMAQNIRDLATISKCRIIVDDVTRPDEPPFQDGPISRAMNDYAADVLFVTSAANSGHLALGKSGTWEGDFEDGGTDNRFPGYRVHKFSNGKLFAEITLQTRRIGLYWSDSWFDSPNEYALVAYDSQDRQLIPVMSNHYNPMQYVDVTGINIGRDPNLQRDYFDIGDKIYLLQKDGSDRRYLRFDTFRGRIDPGTAGNAFGHNAAENVVSVAAVKAPKPAAPFGGGTGVKVEDYSSDGPRRMFFNPDGSPIASGKFLAGPDGKGGRIVMKPDLSAADCVTTTLPAADLHDFCGTSAAAPHVAAIAALIWSLRSKLTPAQVKRILVDSAVDIEDPGWDQLSGYGITMADTAVAAADGLPPGAALEFNGGQNAAGTYAEVPPKVVHPFSGCQVPDACGDPPDSPLQLGDGKYSLAMTLEALVYWDGANGFMPIVSKPSEWGRGYVLALMDGKPMLAIGSWPRTGGGGTFGLSPTPVPAKVWTRVSIAFQSGGGAVTYINGQKVKTDKTTYYLRIPQGSTSLVIGREFSGASAAPTFGGRLADIRIWGTVMSDDEIARWHNKLSLNGHPRGGVLAGRWLLNEGQGTLARDSSSAHDDATLKGGATWGPALP